MLFKKKFLLVLLCLVSATLFGQSNFDSQIKKMSDTITSRLLRTGKKRVAVSNFTDLQGNVTELGKYIAEAFSVELSNTDLEVVDRTRLKDLLNELKLTEEKLTNPANALKLGEMAGVEFIVTGITTPLDNTVDITVKALDIQKGISFGGQRGSVPRTDAINNLMRSTLGNSQQGSSSNAANVNMAKQIDTKDKSALDDLLEAKISDMRIKECYSSFGNEYYGQICFENQTGQDLIFAADAFGPRIVSVSKDGVTLPDGKRNCSSLLVVNYYDKTGQSAEVKFTFQTYGAATIKSATMKLVVEKCKVKSIVLTKQNLVFL